MSKTNFRELVQMSNEELKEIDKPFQRARYLKSIGTSKKVKAHYGDLILCEYCGKTYKRANRSHHNKTQVHLAYSNMNDKIRDLLLKN